METPLILYVQELVAIPTRAPNRPLAWPGASHTRNFLLDIDLEACFRGDSVAWEAFMANTTGLVVAAIRRTIGGGNRPADLELEDIVQAVYLKLVRNDCRLLRSYDPERASMSTWLTLVARSTAIDTLRRQRPSLAMVDEDTPERTKVEPEAPETDLPLHILTARQRLVLTLLFDDDRSVPEAAAILGINEQTVRSTKHKALERLRAYFLTQESGPGDSDAGKASGDDPATVGVET